MKSMIRFIVLILIGFVLASCSNVVSTVASSSPLPKVTPTETPSGQSPTPTPLIIKKTLTENQIAHEAYENAMKNGQLTDIREFAYEYSFYDIDNDGIDEFIAYPGYGAETYVVYNFFEGNINELMSIGQAEDGLIIYPEDGVVSFYTGHMDYYTDEYYQLENEQAYLVAEHDYTDAEPDSSDSNDEYFVNDKETTETKYTEYIETLATGKEVRHEDLNWYQWVSSEYDAANNVYQLKETETNYFRFDSSADNSINFHFNVDPHDPDDTKLQNMKITLCDLDLKPVSKTDSFGSFEQMDYKCTISEEGGYYLKVISEFKKRDNEDTNVYEVFISTTQNDG